MYEFKCPFCEAKNPYLLKSHYCKCRICQKKYSLKKLRQDKEIINAFCTNKNALESAKRLKVNYRTVQNKYYLFRQLITLYLEENYFSHTQSNCAYQEYFFFPKKPKHKNQLLKAINFIAYYHNKKVFTLLMPKVELSDDNKANEDYERYIYWHKLQSEDSFKTPLCIFFAFMEQNLKKYKGIDEKNFFFYLKESEFKYNFLIHEQINILNKLYFQSF